MLVGSARAEECGEWASGLATEGSGASACRINVLAMLSVRMSVNPQSASPRTTSARQGRSAARIRGSESENMP